MTVITAELIASASVASVFAERYAAPMNAAAVKWGIVTDTAIAAWVAECAFECIHFTRMSESFTYRDAAHLKDTFRSKFATVNAAQSYVNNPIPLANYVYAGLYDNGDVASGDGWRYRGRSPLQITFKSGYARAATYCNRPFVEQPDLLLMPEDGCDASGSYWHDRNINLPANAGDIDGVTRKINPGMAGAADRRVLFQQVLKFMGA